MVDEVSRDVQRRSTLNAVLGVTGFLQYNVRQAFGEGCPQDGIRGACAVGEVGVRAEVEAPQTLRLSRQGDAPRLGE